MANSSDRTRAELLRENQQLKEMLKGDLAYRLFEEAPLPYLSLDRGGVILSVNAAWLALLGYERHQVLGTWIGDYLTPSSVELFAKRFCTFISDGRVKNVEFSMIRRHGQNLMVAVNGRIAFDEDGNFLHTHCIFNDVTEKRRAENELADSEQRFRGLFESSIDGIVFSDVHGNIRSVNMAMSKILGLPDGDIVGKRIDAFTSPLWFEKMRDVYHTEVVVNGYSEEHRMELNHSDGHRIPVSLKFWVSRDEDGRPTGAWGVVKDISRTLQAEEALRRSESQYRRIVETANEGIIGLDAGMNVVFSNQVLADFLGYGKAELLGMPVKAVFPEDECTNLEERFAIRNTGEEGRYECRFQRKDGTFVWGLVSASRLESEEGGFTGVFAMVADITDLKKAEEELQESERQYRDIYENSLEGLFQTTPSGALVSANRSTARILGYESVEELLALIEDVSRDYYANPEDRQVLIQRLQLHGEVRDYVLQLRRKDGSLIWGSQNTRMVLDEDGSPVMYESSLMDISERKKAEESLRRSQILLNEVQRMSLTGGWEVDIPTGHVYWTYGQCRLHGVDPGESPHSMADIIHAYVHPKDRETMFADWNSIVRNKVESEIEYRVIKADGTTAILVNKGIPEVDDDGVLKRVYGSTRDVTMERQAARELKLSHQRLLTILDGIDADIYVSDLENNGILFMNAHMRQNFGMPSADAKCHEIFRCKSEPCSFCPKKQLLDENGRPVETLIAERHNPLKDRWYLNHDRAIEWLEGRLVHMHMAADITELKKLEGELKQAMKEAEAANVAKNEFLANMSHEIRTPLNGLLGMLQILQLTRLADEQRDYVDTAVDSGRNLLQILNDILDLSKIESGKLDFDEQEAELGEILDSVVSVFRHTAKSRGVEVSWGIDESLHRHFLVDKGRLRQILFNLVGNAAKFTDSGLVYVEAYPLKRRLADGRLRIYFQITDTGIGIPAGKIDQIFDPFTQVDGTPSRKYQGTGLGLGIVYRLVSLMGGTITVDSDVGKGTTVAFTIAVQPGNPSDESGIAASAGSEHRRLSVLVAEDEPVNRIVVQRFLAKLGHSVECVETGERAIEMLRRKSFDCLLTDIQMPGMDGVETTRIIREELNLDLPVVALTAHAMKGDRARFLKAGMTGYIAKPFEMADLQQELMRVMTVLEKRSAN